MYRVTKTIQFCYGHRLLDYEGPCRNLHGHNGKAEVEFQTAELDSKGMVFDFREIKQVLKKWIDDHLDHVMLLRRDDPMVPILKEKAERFYTMDSNPTAESIARLIFDFAASKHYPVSRVTLWETDSSSATYTKL